MSADTTEIASRLLASVGLGAPTQLMPLAGGRNNRAYRVVNASGVWLFKQYFRGGPDDRDRCGSEWAWLEFGWQHGIHTAPQPLVCVREDHAALLEFIEGRLLAPEEIKVEHVVAAADYLAAVNAHRNDPAATAIPFAAEACRSWTDHAASVTRRLDRLQQFPPHDALDAELQFWLKAVVEPAWRQLSAQLQAFVGAEVWSASLPTEELRLSPSDFGFHNALLTPAGSLRFLDFEYAGWDDPAKLVCDFYWQPARPAPRETRPLLIAALAEPAGHAALTARVEGLFPLHGFRWCCILLNEFLQADRQRREFAAQPVTTDRRREQFTQAQQLFAEVLRLPSVG